MLDVVLNVILIIVSALMCAFLNLSNVALECLIEMIPIAIISFRLWWNKPKTYLHAMGIVNANVMYTMLIKFEQCNFDEKLYEMLCGEIKGTYGQKNGKIVSKNMGEYLWQSYIDVDASLLEINYNLENEDLYLEIKAKTKFRCFSRDVNKLCNIAQRFFGENECSYRNELVKIDISYFNNREETITNPFVTKFFRGFTRVVLDLRYETVNGTKIAINNTGVNILGRDLQGVIADIKKEMLLF